QTVDVRVLAVRCHRACKHVCQRLGTKQRLGITTSIACAVVSVFITCIRTVYGQACDGGVSRQPRCPCPLLWRCTQRQFMILRQHILRHRDVARTPAMRLVTADAERVYRWWRRLHATALVRSPAIGLPRLERVPLDLTVGIVAAPYASVAV